MWKLTRSCKRHMRYVWKTCENLATLVISKRIMWARAQHQAGRWPQIYGYQSHQLTSSLSLRLNTLSPRQNGRLFADDIFKYIFLNENVWISIKISLKFVPKGWINNIPALVSIMAWRCPGDKPLSEPMMVGLLTHICVTRPQWVNTFLFYLIVRSFEIHWLTNLLLAKMAAILQTIFSDAFLWMESFIFWLKFHWNLFLRGQIHINPTLV